MADPLSIAGSVVGILSLGVQTTQYLVKYYTAVKDQPDEIVRTLRKLEDLLDLLQILHKQIEDRESDIKAGKLLSNFSSLITQCEGHIGELQKEVNKYGKMSTRFDGLVQRSAQTVFHSARRATYPFRQDTLEKLDNNIFETLFRLSMLQKALLQRDMENTKAILALIRANQISEEIRNWLKAPDATINLNEACNKKHPDTGLWFVDGPSFSSWLEKPNSFLWLNGFAGTGKSVLCSTAIQRAFRHRTSNSRIGIAFFFFTFSDLDKQNTSSMLRALVVQLSNQLASHTIVEELHSIYHGTTPPNQDLKDTLRQLVRAFDQVYIMLDALDESPRNKDRESVLQAVVDVHAWSEPGLHMLVTSRDEVDIRDEIVGLADESISMKNCLIDKDIASFVKQRLQIKRFKKWNKYHSRIQSTLTERAKGNFRWVECQLQALSSCPASEDLFDRLLNSLPESLDETYKRMLVNIEPKVKDYAQRMLMLLCCATRPLRAVELLDGLAIDFDDKPSFNPKRRLVNVKQIEEICPGLVEMDMHRDTYGPSHMKTNEVVIRIAHFSVQEYLESDRIRQNEQVKSFAVHPTQAHTQITSACLMLFVEPTFIASPDKYPIVHYAATYWPHHFEQGVETANIKTQLLRLFRNINNAFDNWYEISFQMELKPPKSPLPYACSLGLLSIVRELINEVKSNGEKSYGGFGVPFGIALNAAATLGQEEIVQLFFDKKCDIDVSDKEWIYSLIEAARYGQEKIVQLFLDRGIDANGIGTYHQTALSGAASSGYEKIVHLLLRRNADINRLKHSEWRRLTSIMISRGYQRIFRILLENKADTNAHGDILREASNDGQEEIVRLLLDRGVEVDSRDEVDQDDLKRFWTSPKSYGSTTHGVGQPALSAASAKGHEGTVRLLLDRNAEINARDALGRTPLFGACENDHEQVVQLLLSRNANLHLQDHWGRTPLQVASGAGKTNIVRLLIDRGAINMKDNKGRTPLSVASEAGQTGMVQILVDGGAINTKDDEGRTPLLIAMMRNHIKIVQLLLDHNAHIDQTTLWEACRWGYIGMVYLILDLGVDINIQDKSGATLLIRATERDHRDIIRLLLNRNADINVRDHWDRTVLWMASIKGFGDIVQSLLERNADVDVQSTYPGEEGLNAFAVAEKYEHKHVMKIIKPYLRKGVVRRS